MSLKDDLSTKTIEKIKAYGNEPNAAHVAGIQKLAALFDDLLTGEKTGWYVTDGPTGFSKTTMARMLIKLIQEQELPYAIVLAASRVQQICDLYLELQEDGVDMSEVALLHSKRYAKSHLITETAPDGSKILTVDDDKYAPLPATPSKHDTQAIQARKFVLMTHASIHANPHAGMYNWYRKDANGSAKDRELLIWDEMLISALVAKLELGQLQKEALDREWDDPDYLNVVHRLRDIGEAAAVSEMTEFVLEAPLRTMEPYVLRRIAKTLEQEGYENLAQFTAFYNEPVKLQVQRDEEDNCGVTLLQFKPAIPGELENIVVLDASSKITRPEDLNDQLHYFPLDVVFDYSDVAFRVADVEGNAKHTLKKQIAEEGVNQSHLAEAIVQAKAWQEANPDSHQLIFTHKTITVSKEEVYNCRDLLQTGLAQAGLDTSRIFVETWGRETASNHYSHCDHIILATWFRLGDEIAGDLMAAEANHLRKQLTQRDKVRFDIQHMLGRLYQAVQRGRARRIRDGKASPMTVTTWTNNRQALHKLIDAVMVQATIEPLELLVLTPKVTKQSYLRDFITQSVITAGEEADQRGRAVSVKTKDVLESAQKEAPFHITKEDAKAARKPTRLDGIRRATGRRFHLKSGILVVWPKEGQSDAQA